MTRMMITTALVALTSGSAWAQDAICAGQAPGNWAGGDAARSDLSTVEQALDITEIAPLGKVITTQFTLSEAASVRLEAKGGLGADPRVELYDADGDLIAEDDDSGLNSAAMLAMDLDEGAYCLVTKPYEEGGVIAATLRLGRAEHEALTDGGAAGATGACTGDDLPQITLSGDAEASDLPYDSTVVAERPVQLRLTVTGAAPVTMTADGEDADPNMALYDDSGELVEENDDTNGLNAQLDFPEGLEAGEYCLTVNALSDTSKPITLRLQALDSEAYRSRGYDSGEVSPLIGGTHPISDLGALNGRLIAESATTDVTTWLSFATDQASLVVIDAIAMGETDPTLTLFDEIGQRLGGNDDRDTQDTNSRLVLDLVPGRYVLGLGKVDEDAAPVRLVLTQYARLQPE